MFQRLFFLLLLFLVLAAGVIAGEITLTPQNIRIANGALEFTAAYPVLAGKPAVRPQVTVTDAATAELRYGDKGTVLCKADGNGLVFTSTGMTSNTRCTLEGTLPLSWGGKTTWQTQKMRTINQGKDSGDFPVDVFVPPAGQWSMFDGVGNILLFQQGEDRILLDSFCHWTLKDDRKWRWQRYSFVADLTFQDARPVVFRISFPDKGLPKSAPAAAPAATAPKKAASPSPSDSASPLELTEKGLKVKYGAYDTLLQYPIYKYGSSWDKLVHPRAVTISGDKESAVLDYGDGCIVKCHLREGVLDLDFNDKIQNHPGWGAGWLEMNINEVFTQNGGQWDFFDAHPSAMGKAFSPFPQEKAEKWFSFSGVANGCKIATSRGTGDTMTFRSDRAYYYMKDCRLWGKYWFTLCIRPVLKGGKAQVSLAFSRGTAVSKVVDRFGQLVNFDFPEKVRSVEELKADVAKDDAYYASLSKPDWTFWGGLPGSREKYGLTATGFFHIEKVAALDNRPVLVEPEGNLYFHIGMSGMIRGNETTCVQGREDIYEELPPLDNSPESAAWYMRPPRGKAVSHYVWNYVRKYGSFDQASWQKKMIERCRRWGFNAFGEFTFIYGDNDREGFAITRCLENYAQHKPFRKICNDFIDPYEPANLPLLEEEFGAEIRKWVGKPILLGYYTENETSYNSVVPAILAMAKSEPAKVRFAEFMRERYHGDFAAFNKSWHLDAASFDQLKTLSVRADKVQANPVAAEDLGAFEHLFFDDYFRMLSGTLKKLDPDHLYLGERMLMAQTFNDAVVKAMGKYCDVFSVNHYTDEIDPADLERFGRISGLPVMLSEWSYGSHDQGQYGAKNKANDEERGCAYSRYMENAVASSCVVGQQYFIFLDESVTGRGFTVTNGERFNMGMVNVCDRPYKKFAAHVAESNKKVYRLLTREIAPVPTKIGTAGHAESLTMPVGRVKPGFPLNALRDKYPGRPGTAITRSVAGSNPKANDKADMICGWDDKFLYVLVTIQDSTPASNTHKQGIWQGDSVEFFYGPYAENVTKMRPYDRQVGIRGNTLAEPDFRWDNAGTRLENAPRPASFVRIAPDGKSWAMEVALPWSEIGVTPKSGMKINYDIAINLNGDTNNTQANKLVWNGLETNYYRRDLWGTIVLED